MVKRDRWALGNGKLPSRNDGIGLKALRKKIRWEGERRIELTSVMHYVPTCATLSTNTIDLISKLAS